MVIQHTKYLNRKKLPSVIKCIKVGNMRNKKIVIVGMQNNMLYILSPKFKIYQSIEFPNWVRSIAVADITKNGYSEIIIGCGDSTLRVFQYFKKKKKYVERTQTKFDDFVDAVAVADIDNDGELEIVAGSWDNTVRAFKYIAEKPIEKITKTRNNQTDNNSTKDEIELEENGESLNNDYENPKLKLLWRQDLEEGITKCKIADTNWDGNLSVIALVKYGKLCVLAGDTGEIQWSFANESKKDFNGFDVAPLDLSGYPYLVAGGNDKTLYFFNSEGANIYSIELEERITSLTIGDIDGGDHPEIIIGKTSVRKNRTEIPKRKLAVFELTDTNLESIQLKWELSVSGVINSIEISDIDNDGIKNILFGGYDLSLGNIQDYNYNLKPDIGITLPEIEVSHEVFAQEFASLEEEDTINYETMTSEESIALAEGDEYPLFRKGDEAISDETIGIVSEKINAEPTPRVEISEELPEITQGISKEREEIEYTNIITETNGIAIQSTSNADGTADTDIQTKQFQSIELAIASIFKDKKIISKKSILMDKLEGLLKGMSADELFEYTKDNDLIQYSRSKPRGYSLSVPIEELKIAIKENKIPIPNEELEIAEGTEYEEISDTEQKTKEEVKISTPLKEERKRIETPAVVASNIEDKDQEVEVKKAIVEEWGAAAIKAIYALFEREKLISRKDDLLQALSWIVKGITGNKVYELAYNANIIQYSRSKPRGYSIATPVEELKISIKEREITLVDDEAEIADGEEYSESLDIEEEIQISTPLKEKKKKIETPAVIAAEREDKKEEVEVKKAAANEWGLVAIEAIKELFKKETLISRKDDLLQALSWIVKGMTGNEIYELASDANIVEYSRSKPRGYSLVSMDNEEILEELKEEKKEEIKDLKADVKKIFDKTPLISSKAKLLKVLEPLDNEKNPEDIYELCKDFINYSRSKPRGYSFNP